MLQSPLEQSTEVLAHWHYEPELWSDFVRFESERRDRSIRSAKYFIYGTLIIAIILIGLLLLIPFLTNKSIDSNIWGPIFGISTIAEICGVIGVIVLLMRRQKLAKLSTPTGEVIVTTHQLKINDVEFNWGQSETGWQFINATRKNVNVTPLKKIEIIELRFEILIPHKTQPMRETVEWRIPVAPGRLAEADRVIDRLRAESRSLSA